MVGASGGKGECTWSQPAIHAAEERRINDLNETLYAWKKGRNIPLRMTKSLELKLLKLFKIKVLSSVSFFENKKNIQALLNLINNN